MMVTRLLFFIAFACVAGCNSNKPYSLNLMKAPEVFDEKAVNPFTDVELLNIEGDVNILYATDRNPIGASTQSPYYESSRGHVLRMGAAEVALKGREISWEETKRISLLKDRSEKYPIYVSKVREFGMLPSSIDLASANELSMSQHSGLDEFNATLSQQLQNRQKKDVYIYVHGYKVIFDNPILVANELWHYLGYEGVFIAYAWPSTKRTLAYNKDIETASYTSRNLRRLIESISDNDNVERINIIGYSAGTRVVTEALWQLALKYGADKQAYQSLKLHDIILAGSDVDRDQAVGYASDGMLDIIDKLTIYQSSKDKALGVSSWLFGRQRLGQRSNTVKPINSSIIDYIRQGKLDVIDVTNASQALKRNGHSYFRSSPWVSSDVLMNLRYDLEPKKRGLIKNQSSQNWSFPDDYIQRLRNQLLEFNQTRVSIPN